MENNLARQRCYNHARREAVARCPECGRYYCRECVTEHEDRILCASCLVKRTGLSARKRAPLAAVGRLCLFVFGTLTLWLFFLAVGKGLLALPSAFHDGGLWRTGVWEALDANE